MAPVLSTAQADALVSRNAAAIQVGTYAARDDACGARRPVRDSDMYNATHSLLRGIAAAVIRGGEMSQKNTPQMRRAKAGGSAGKSAPLSGWSRRRGR